MFTSQSAVVDKLLAHGVDQPGLSGERRARRGTGGVDGAAPQSLTVAVLRVGGCTDRRDLEYPRRSAGGVTPTGVACLPRPSRINVRVDLHGARVARLEGHGEVGEGQRLAQIVLGRNGGEEVEREGAAPGCHGESGVRRGV